MKQRRLAFITSTRSDYAKQQPYMVFFAQQMPVSVFVTSMHLNPRVGLGRPAIEADWRGQPQVSLVWDESFAHQQPLSGQLSHLMGSVTRFLQNQKIDFLFVHGDRLEALAGALAASFLKIPVCQIEAGDLSGNIDEAYRHAITKLAQRFLVDDEPARQIVRQLGEDPHSIFITGNVSLWHLPGPEEQQHILQKYGLKEPFSIVLYHPQTNLSQAEQYACAARIVQTLNTLPGYYVVLAPNNDPGYEQILRAFDLFDKNKTVFLKSLPCREFLSLLNHSVCLIGNSSSGLKEAPLLGVASVNIGSRQFQREKGRRLERLIPVTDLSLLEAAVQKAVGLTSKNRPAGTDRAALQQRLTQIFTDEFFSPALQKIFYSL